MKNKQLIQNVTISMKILLKMKSSEVCHVHPSRDDSPLFDKFHFTPQIITEGEAFCLRRSTPFSKRDRLFFDPRKHPRRGLPDPTRRPSD